MGESVERTLDIRDVHKMWDASEDIRMRIRSGYGLLHEKSALCLDNYNATLNAPVLRPLLMAMGKLPGVPDLRSELSALFESSKRTGPEVAKFVATEPTRIRKLCSFVKAKCRREEVSQDLRMHVRDSIFSGV